MGFHFRLSWFLITMQPAYHYREWAVTLCWHLHIVEVSLSAIHWCAHIQTETNTHLSHHWVNFSFLRAYYISSTGQLMIVRPLVVTRVQEDKRHQVILAVNIQLQPAVCLFDPLYYEPHSLVLLWCVFVFSFDRHSWVQTNKNLGCNLNVHSPNLCYNLYTYIAPFITGHQIVLCVYLAPTSRLGLIRWNFNDQKEEIG